jgi:hypothetical protein
MRPLATKMIVFNAAAALIGVAALVAAGRSMLVSPTAAPCAERYHSMTAFSMERGGVTLTAADLQASLGGRDVGVIENVTIGQVPNAPAPLAMGVSLQRHGANAAKAGTAFPWEPRVLQSQAQACLSYHVLFPADFDFTRGGALPGIGGTAAGGQGDGFLARLSWRTKGVVGATVRVTGKGVMAAVHADREDLQLPRGRWVRLEQEVVLNAPGKSDGILRLWVDGTLAVDRTDITYRATPDVAISGVSVDVFSGSGPDDAQAAPSKPARVWLTPFEVRW